MQCSTPELTSRSGANYRIHPPQNGRANAKIMRLRPLLAAGDRAKQAQAAQHHGVGCRLGHGARNGRVGEFDAQTGRIAGVERIIGNRELQSVDARQESAAGAEIRPAAEAGTAGDELTIQIDGYFVVSGVTPKETGVGCLVGGQREGQRIGVLARSERVQRLSGIAGRREPLRRAAVGQPFTAQVAILADIGAIADRIARDDGQRVIRIDRAGCARARVV